MPSLLGLGGFAGGYSSRHQLVKCEETTDPRHAAVFRFEFIAPTLVDIQLVGPGDRLGRTLALRVEQDWSWHPWPVEQLRVTLNIGLR